jgi:hypothetical protein
VIALAAALSAVLANDVVCLAVTPVLAVGCLRRGLRPEPYLLALACAANVGSAATLIGNPQNMLIGQRHRQPDRGRAGRAAGDRDRVEGARAGRGAGDGGDARHCRCLARAARVTGASRAGSPPPPLLE